MLMVKPGMAYLDIVRQTKDKVLQVLIFFITYQGPIILSFKKTISLA